MEKELKFGLTAQEYRKLNRLSHSPKTQKNTYFDFQNKLGRGGAGLRLREQTGKAPILTLKAEIRQTAKKAKQGWHVRQEWEQSVSPKVASALRRGKLPWAHLDSTVVTRLRALFPKLNLESLKAIGTLKTRRSILKVGKFKGELDAAQVGRHRFYELEVETSASEAARRAVESFFECFEIPLRPRAETKLGALMRLSRKR
ncbi:CYTH domain-containing protein [bacterium]|nr:CYTH domain-containing protein [bacterium]